MILSPLTEKMSAKVQWPRKRGIETFIAFLWYNSMRIYQHKRHPKHSSNLLMDDAKKMT